MDKKKAAKEIPTTFTEPTLDPAAGMEISQDEDIFMKTLTTLVKDSLEGMLKDIRNSIVKGPIKEFRRSAHSLKGAASYTRSCYKA